MRIAQSLIDEMVAHAREDLPNECCGLVGGVDGAASVVIPVENSAASPLRFEMDPQGQYDALKAIEGGGGEMLAIYHSHTKSAAYPSQTDVNQAVNWPDAVRDRLARGTRRARRQGLLAEGPEDRRCRARRRVAGARSGSRLLKPRWRPK